MSVPVLEVGTDGAFDLDAAPPVLDADEAVADAHRGEESSSAKPPSAKPPPAPPSRAADDDDDAGFSTADLRARDRANYARDCEVCPAPQRISAGGTNADADAKAPVPPEFEPSASFSGARPGAVYKLGPRGMGYYADADGDAAAAAAASASGGTSGYYHFSSTGERNSRASKWDSYDVDAELEKLDAEDGGEEGEVTRASFTSTKKKAKAKKEREKEAAAERAEEESDAQRLERCRREARMEGRSNEQVEAIAQCMALSEEQVRNLPDEHRDKVMQFRSMEEQRHRAEAQLKAHHEAAGGAGGGPGADSTKTPEQQAAEAEAKKIESWTKYIMGMKTPSTRSAPMRSRHDGVARSPAEAWAQRQATTGESASQALEHVTGKAAAIDSSSNSNNNNADGGGKRSGGAGAGSGSGSEGRPVGSDTSAGGAGARRKHSRAKAGVASVGGLGALPKSVTAKAKARRKTEKAAGKRKQLAAIKRLAAGAGNSNSGSGPL